MIRLAQIIDIFEAAFLQQYGGTLPSGQRYALTALKHCRSAMSPKMQAACGDCAQHLYVPHSCGHRSCPHCQAHASQQWIDRQLHKQVPGDYFMITFTLSAELRPLARANPHAIYERIMQSAWDTLLTFSLNDKTLQGTPGAVGVLHTHHRRLDFHRTSMNKSLVTSQALDTLGRLYAIERQAADLGAVERQALRMNAAKPVLDAWRVWLIETRGHVPGSSGTARAIDYALRRWTAIMRYLDDEAYPLRSDAWHSYGADCAG